MNTSAVFESAGLSLRKVQQDYIEAAAGALTQDHKVALISAETGVGKTLGYLVPALLILGNDSNLLIVFYVQIMPDDFVMQLHRF
ncbi:DEAD/DEAH box helicase family protein [Citrobacter youngae]|uniref:DEAD/DEAH box helicase family protein n=1 Tax=Citrobacter youngae TaxID=133448 RepID=UPI001EE3E551